MGHIFSADFWNWLFAPLVSDSNLRVIDLFYVFLAAVLVILLVWYLVRAQKTKAKKIALLEPIKSIELPEQESKTAPARMALPVSWNRVLQKSREPFLARLQDAFSSLLGSEQWNGTHPIWEALEEALITSDIGPKMTANLLESLKQEFKEKPDLQHLKQVLRARMQEVFAQAKSQNADTSGPRVTLLMGVNGSGKTTTAGKLAFQAKALGKKVVLGAADTFRAAAVEQLQSWANRIGVECIVPAKGANPAAVAFDTVAAGISRGADEIIIDTAGRLHTKESLMDELRKLAKTVGKKIPGAPHRVLLVLDATLGQNALIQAREFTNAIPATGVVLTKLDGSAKGGAALSIAADLGLPVELVGVGETPEDLRAFSALDFVANLIPDA